MVQVGYGKPDSKMAVQLLRISVPVCAALLLIASAVSAGGASLQKLQPSLKSLDLSRPPGVEEIMAAGQLGGQLYPTEDGGAGADNLSFGAAMDSWNRHEYKKAVKMLRKHMTDYPDSPWAAEAALHIGCDAQYNGRYKEARDLFEGILKDTRGKSHPGAKALYDKATLRLGVLKVFQNNPKAAAEQFRELKKNAIDWRERTYAAHWLHRLSRMKGKGRAMFNCGSLALARMFEERDLTAEAKKILEILPETAEGQSISDLVRIAAQQGYLLDARRLSPDDLSGLSLPAVVHLNAQSPGDSGHYWVLEAVEGDELKLFDPQAGKYFFQRIPEFAPEWSGYALAFTDGALQPGVLLAENDTSGIFGGCCGVPRAEDDLGCPDGKCKGGAGGPGYGAPVWTVNMVNMNLFMTDIPLWYASPIGPPVEIGLSYNSQSAIAHNEPFGNKWQFGYASYLVVDTAGEVTVFMPDGRRDVYKPNGSGGYAKPYRVHNTLTRIAENHFHLAFPDGTVHVYNIPAGTGSLQPFLVEVRDPYGQKLTFTYDASIRLIRVTDAAGKQTSLTYNASGLVTRVTDPFGRSALFEYDGNRNLTRITDMGGYWTNFTYDQDVYLSGVENAAGSWGFYIEPADGIDNDMIKYPAPGADMWENYRITVTNPLGGKEEYYYEGYSSYGWYQSPKHYTTNLSEKIFSRKYDYQIDYESNRGEISQVEFPEGGLLGFYYDANGNLENEYDALYNFTEYTYNSVGMPTSVTDAKYNTTTLNYAPNGFDLTGIVDGRGMLSLAYNAAHDITSITDRLGNTTTVSYNPYGRPVSMSEPLGVTTSYSYDSSQYLTQISRNGTAVKSYTYDGKGRVRTATDSAGITLTFDYNDLDDITRVTYPDGKFITITYSAAIPHLITSITDRAGRSTTYTYDALKRVTRVINPENGATVFEYDKNGNLTRLIDTNGNVTAFRYDNDDRLVERKYADGGRITYTYDIASRQSTATNARGRTASFSYDENHNPVQISYSDATPGVSFEYDAFDRRVRMVDGSGTYLYGYDKNSRLTSFDGPWANDTVTFEYDALGRRTRTAVNGVTNAGYTYDTLNRLTGVSAGGGVFTYAYQGGYPLANSLTRPNGSVTGYQYDLLGRLTDVSNRNSSAAIINRYVYGYGQHDLRSTETVTNGAPITTFLNRSSSFTPNRVNQLISSTAPVRTYSYDADGNMISGYTPEGYQFSADYDAENRLVSIRYTDNAAVLKKTDYLYNGDGFRAVRKEYSSGALVGETRYVRNGPLVLQERNGSNAVTGEYAWGRDLGGGIGGLLNLARSGQHNSYLYDGKGNVTALINGSQAVVAAYAHDPFGVPLARSGTLDQPYRFSTREYDEKTGLSYYGYRFYLPGLGRWTSRDPLGEEGGMNLYGFVRNNPVNRIDPLGLEDESSNPFDKAFDKFDKKYKGKGRSEYQKLLKETKDNCDSTWSFSKKLKELWDKAGDALSGEDGSKGNSPPKPPSGKPKIRDWVNR